MKLAVLIALLCMPAVLAQSGHITALSVIDENQSIGGVADIFLEIKPGTGAVYIESFPLTKIDTQIATREANEIACQRSTVDCDQYDFFYLINVRSSVIGGPSAGGATAVLTYALLEGLTIDNETAMTGAILSGGIIGPVGGVPAKVSGAQANGFERVLIPAWETNDTREQLTDEYDIEVVRIRNLDEAIYYFTGQEPVPPRSISPPSEYTQGMQRVSVALCEHAALLAEELNQTNETQSVFTSYERAQNASVQGAHYTAASLCFSSALRAQTLTLETASNETKQTVLQSIVRNHATLSKAVQEQQPLTISDLEVQMIVTERLEDVQEALDGLNDTELDAADLAYAYERLETATAWYSMFGKVPSKELDISDERLELSCRQKLQEAQERVNYLSYIFPGYTQDLERSLRTAFASAQAEKYSLCLLQASQAKAEANAVMTAIYVPIEEIPSVTAEKLSIGTNQLARQADQEVFPMLGYSYNEYSRQLLASEPYSAGLYAEYSLELGNLEIYFPPQKQEWRVDMKMLGIFSVGVLFGALCAVFIQQLRHQSEKVESRRPKKVTFARNLPGKKR